MIQNLRCTLFGKYENLGATPERISNILVSMISKGIQVVPGTFQQINPAHGMQTFDRMQFFNQKDNFTILFNVDSIQITTNIINDKSYNLEKNINSFISAVNKFFSSIDALEEKFPNAQRVSLIVSLLYDNNEIKELETIYDDFSNKLPNYKPEETFEWSTRAVKRSQFEILEHQEKFNIVSDVMRTQGQVDKNGSTSNFDTINTVLDINTLNEVQDERIDSEFAKIFFSKAVDLFFENYKLIEVKLVDQNR